MTSLRTEWLSTPIPELITHLLNNFHSLGDQKSDDTGRQLGEDIFTPIGQIVVKKRKLSGTAGMTEKQNNFANQPKSG